jgi:MFS family permease
VVAYFAVLGVANGVWLARIPAIKQNLHLTDGTLGLALLAAPAGLVVVVPFAGRIVHRVGSRRPTLIAGICSALVPIALGLAPSRATLMAALFAFGLAGGLLDVAMNSQAVLVERAAGRPLMTGFHACYSFGGLAGALLGGIFAWAVIAPAVNFTVVAIPVACVAVFAGRWLLPDQDGNGAEVLAAAGPADVVFADPAAGPETTNPRPATARPAEEPADGSAEWPTTQAGERAAEQPAEHAAGPRAEHAAERSAEPAAEHHTPRRSRLAVTLVLMALLAVCSLLGEGAAEGWSAVYLRDNLGTSAGLAALAYAGFSVAMAFGRLAGDRLALRFGAAALMRCCGLVAAAGLSLALLRPSPVGAIAGFSIFGVGLSSTFPLLLSAAGNADPARPSHGIARVAGFGYAGMLGGPVLIGGLASAFGLRQALAVPVLLALVVAAGAGVVAPRGQPPGYGVRRP